MPRSIRIEYPGAIYHVMARGNRRQEIFLSDEDREIFIHTFGQACERTGWKVLAWTLMPNHYHLALITPEPNLVAGMTWFQNTYTRRFNTRHRQWGRLFGDRYKAIPVQPSEATGGHDSASGFSSGYLGVLIDYIHLNPVRAGLIQPIRGESVVDFKWSSLASAYAAAPVKREPWMDVETGLALAGCRDTSKDRRRYITALDQRAACEDSGKCGLPDPKNLDAELVSTISTGSKFQRGWYIGGEDFRDQLLQKSSPATDQNATYRSSGMNWDHAEAKAESILQKASKHFGLKGPEQVPEQMERGDLTRVAVAWAITRWTSVPQAWTARRLNLKSATNVSQRCRRFDLMEESNLSQKFRSWKKVMSKFFD